MSSFLSSVKADLLGVRLRLVVLILAIGLVAAVAYVVLGGKGNSTAQAGGSAAVPTGTRTGLVIREGTTNAAVVIAETTSGTSPLRKGAPHNPFTPLPAVAPTGATGVTSSAATPGSASSTSASSVSGSSAAPSGGTTPTATTKPTAPTKTKITVHYHVAAEFGVIPGTSGEATAKTPAPSSTPVLRTYADMSLDEPLPDKSNPQLVFLGVVLRTGKSAVFALGGEEILHGSAVCLPSATQCQTIELQPGQSETLETVEPNGTAVTYELKLVSIVKSLTSATTASAHTSARAHVASHPALSIGREVLRRKGGVTAISGLEYSHAEGVLVFAAHRASARAAAQRPRRRR